GQVAGIGFGSHPITTSQIELWNSLSEAGYSQSGPGLPDVRIERSRPNQDPPTERPAEIAPDLILFYTPAGELSPSPDFESGTSRRANESHLGTTNAARTGGGIGESSPRTAFQMISLNRMS